jgi:energy-coupling factor transport system permease protein
MLFNHPAFVGGVLMSVLALALTSRLPQGPVWRVLSASAFIFVASVVVYPIYLKRGPELFQVAGIIYTRDALLYALAVGMRLMTMTAMSMIIILTTSPSATVLGLEHLGLPYRAAVALSMMVRFLPTLWVEGNTIIEAQKSRALQLDQGNPIARARKYTPILIPLFIRSFLLAKQLGLALDGRGFGLGNSRTHLLELRLTRVDRIFVGFWATLVIAAVIARWLGFGVLIPSLV